MIKLIMKIIGSDSVGLRSRCGTVSGVAGMLLNLMLFAFKLVAGILSNSAAIMADAFNNLSDTGSSVITYIGFKLAGKPADRDHPYGHGRIEYVAGLFVSVVIIMVGLEFLKTSVAKIITPEAVIYTTLSIIILAVSVAVKFIMYLFNKGIGKEIGSAALMATAQDSFNDCVATTAVLIGIIISKTFDINIDGYLGLAVAVFIIYSGIKAAGETIEPVLGQAADPQLKCMIKSEVLKDKRILGIHDLYIHNYGPSKTLMSLHAEVDSKGNVLELHDMIDSIEKDLKAKFNCDAVIHMDPIVIDDEKTNEMRKAVAELAKEIDSRITIHDFRMTDGHTHTNLIFDVVVPFDIKFSDNEISEMIEEKINKLEGKYFICIEIDKE